MIDTYKNVRTLIDAWDIERTVYWCNEPYLVWRAGVINRINLLFNTNYNCLTDDSIILPYLLDNSKYKNLN